MKKLILTLVVMILTVISGCSTEESPNSLKQAYMEIAQQIEDGESINFEMVKQKLVDYVYEERELEGLKYHVFMNENEVLNVAETGSEDKIVTELMYEFIDGTNTVTLSYGTAGNEKNLNVFTGTYSQELDEKIASILETKEMEFLNQYNEINKIYISEPTLTVSQLKEMLQLEPTVYDEHNKDTNYYSFRHKNSGEVIGVYTLKGSEKISRLIYAALPELMKDTIQKELRPTADDTMFHIIAQVEALEIQNEVMALFSK